MIIMKQLENKEEKLPYLLEYYKNHFELEDTSEKKLYEYSEKNNLPDEFAEILKAFFKI